MPKFNDIFNSVLGFFVRQYVNLKIFLRKMYFIEQREYIFQSQTKQILLINSKKTELTILAQYVYSKTPI